MILRQIGPCHVVALKIIEFRLAFEEERSRLSARAIMTLGASVNWNNTLRAQRAYYVGDCAAACRSRAERAPCGRVYRRVPGFP